MAKMLNRNRKRALRSDGFTPFTKCPCCVGPTPIGKAAEKIQWKKYIEGEQYD